MNSKDRDRLRRIYRAINDLPGMLDGGSQQATLRGALGYGRDQMKFNELLLPFLLNSFHPDGNSEEPDQDIEDSLIELEIFIDKRKSEGWKFESAGQNY